MSNKNPFHLKKLPHKLRYRSIKMSQSNDTTGTIQNDSYQPLSPVLGSGQSLKKFMKNRKRSKGNMFKVVQTLGHDLEPKQIENSVKEIVQREEKVLEDVQPLNDDSTLLDMTNTSILERIKKLDALECNTKDIQSSISLSVSCESPPIEKAVTVYKYENRLLPDVASTIEHLEPLPSSDCIKFKTGHGQNIDIPHLKLIESKELFSDILNPESTKLARRNKFQYMHKQPPEVDKHNNDNIDSKLSFQPALAKITSMESITSGSKENDQIKYIDTPLKKNSQNLWQVKTLNKQGRSIFENENFDDLKTKNFPSFKSAKAALNSLGTVDESKSVPECKSDFAKGCKVVRNIAVDFEPVPKKNILGHLGSIFKDENFDDLKTENITGFNSASALINLEKKSSEIANEKTLISNYESKLSSHTSDSEAVRMEPSKNNEFKNIFGNENFGDVKMNVNSGFSTASSALKSGIEIGGNHHPKNAKGFKNIFEGENFDDLNCNFSIKTTNKEKKGYRNIFEGENFDDLNLKGFTCGFKAPSLFKSYKQPNDFQSPLETSIKTIIPKSKSDDSFTGFSAEEKEITKNISNNSAELVNIIDNKLHSSSPTDNKDIINLSESIQADKEKLCFENSFASSRKRKVAEVDKSCNTITPLRSRQSKKRLGCFISPTIQLSERGLKRAKLMFEDLEGRPPETSTPMKVDSNNRQFFCDFTPIKTTTENITFMKSKDVSKDLYTSKLEMTVTESNRFSFNNPSAGNVWSWLDNLQEERRVLEEKLRIINDKQTILTSQKTMMESSSRGKKRIVPGVLSKAKLVKGRISLRRLVMDSTPCEGSFLEQINPENAHLVHFCLQDKRVSYIKTEDGAVLVPNNESKIGLSEIEHSFKLVEGVDPNLIPKGWLANHFKWIVWKLASYERRFSHFERCFSVENVIQQLKYRYDIEIDNVKRPIIRKIFEKDECSQRRMVLCVSKITKVNNGFELELTDGWYSIRTIPDSPLCEQIAKGRIHIGVKLLIYNADLVNCDGCYPLEATEFTYLKISFNTTRRALWWCKLGYQKEAGPFLIPMNSINLDGGKVGCIKCFIARVYPVKYMEKCGSKNVWRNRRAEDRRAQEFYSETSARKIPKQNYQDIRIIKDPETLYSMVEGSCDSDGVQEILSDHQKSILYNYTLNRSDQMHKSSHKYRNVTAVLKMKLVDASCVSDKIHEFHVWRPGEDHLQELKEGEIITIFNISCSRAWGLSSSQLTKFQKKAKPKDDRFEKFKRKVTYIEDLPRFVGALNEFDCVGLVVKKEIGNTQHVWMTDSQQRLLLVKINDSPKNIMALDTTNEGQIVSVCNLMPKTSYDTHFLATADHSVVFARYSQYHHLQDALEKTDNDFAYIDRSDFLKACSAKIKGIETKPNTTPHMDLDGMECSQITLTDVALLECVDKLI